jgi:hypothetical protein
LKKYFQALQYLKYLLFQNDNWSTFNIPQIFKIACIRQGVQVDDIIVSIFCNKQPGYMRAYKTGTTGDDNRFFTLYFAFYTTDR